MEKIINKFLVISLIFGILFGGIAFLMFRTPHSSGAGGSFAFPLLEYLDINLQKLNLEVVPYDGEEIIVEYKNDRPLEIEIGDNELIITENDKFVMSLFAGKSSEFGLKLYLPQVLFRDISIYTSTGSVTVGEIDCNKLGVITESGDVIVKNMGYLGSISTTSGDVYINMGYIVNDTDILNRSGNIELTVPHESSLAVDFKTTDGECKTDMLNRQMYGNYLYQFNGGKKCISVTAEHGTFVLKERT